MRVPLLALALIFGVFSQDVDNDVTVPANANVVALEAQGRGVQIYSCAQQGIAYGWTFKAPEAALVDSAGQALGTHGAGPSWIWKDGSSITGKVLFKRASPDPLSIDWLLLTAKPVAGASGALTGITYVRRSDTHGGVPPADGCDAAHPNATVRVQYTATYTFYREAR